MVAKFIHKRMRRISRYFGRNKGRLRIRTPNNDPSTLSEWAAKENALTTPPDDENINLYGVWGVEIYTSMQFDALENGLREIGWSTDKKDEEFDDPIEWLRHGRHSFGVGSVESIEARTIERRPFRIKGSRSLRLPKNMERGHLRILSLSPSMIAVVAWFELTEDGSRCYDEVLRTDRTFVYKRQRGLRRRYGPKSQKYDHIDQTRSEIIASIWNWFGEYMPGVFASGLLRDELPTCEFVTIQNAEPLSDRVKEHTSNDGWLDILGLQSDSRAWEYSPLPGLRIALPGYRLFAPKFHSLAAINWSKLTEDTDEDYPRVYWRRMRQINEALAHVLCAWSVVAMFEGYVYHLVQVRKGLIQGNSTSTNVADVLKNLKYEIAYSSDIATIATELSNNDRLILASLRQCNSFKRRSNADESEQLTLKKYLITLSNTQYKDVLRNDQTIRDHMTQYGALLSARENIRLQRSIFCFSILVFLVTVLSAFSFIASLEMLNFWDWVRSLDFLQRYSWLDWFMDLGANE